MSEPKKVNWVYVPVATEDVAPEKLTKFCLKLTQAKALGLEPVLVDITKKEAIFIADEDLLLSLRRDKPVETENIIIGDFGLTSKKE